MLQSEYDPDDDGSVLKADHADDADTVDGHTVARNVLSDEYTNTEIDTALSGKQDKEEGKGLSSNDFTDALKTKLDGIEAGAQVNTLTGVKGSAESDYRTGNVEITKANIGLGNVDNTSDANKPISTATQTALDAKQGTLTAGTGITINDNVISATGGGGSGGHVIVNSSGTDMTQRAKLKFDGATVTDDAVNDMTIVSGLKGDPGDPGDPGTAATIAVGTVTSGQMASVTNSGTSSAAVFDFVLPKGDQGDPGTPGQDGQDGAAATIEVGTVTSGQTASVTNSGTSSAAVFDFVLPKGDPGQNGQDGTDGTDGVSPTVSTSAITGGTQVTITDADGPHVFDVMDGADGSPGTPGQDGTDGVSPTVSTTAITGGTEITITDAGGSHTFNVMDGTPGTPGQDGTDGVSPTVSTSAITGGTAVVITDAQGTHTFNVMNGTNGQDGAPGQDGTDGTDGFSPTVSTSSITGGTEVTITDANGPHVFDVMDGATGQTGPTGPSGADGYSPTATVTKTGSTVTITITDKNGTTTATVSDGDTGPVVALIDRWLRFDPNNKKGLIIKAGTHILKDDGTYQHYDSDTAVDLTSDLGGSGTDYFVYLANDGTISAGTSQPADTVKIGRFHTLCANVGTPNMILPSGGITASNPIMVKSYKQEEDPDFYAFYRKTISSVSGEVATVPHPLSGFSAGDILPESVFCLTFHPDTLVEDAMVYDRDTDRVIDVYLQSGKGVNTRSAYNATHTVSRQPINHQEDMRAVGKKLLTDHEFTSAAIGSNEKTNITGSADKTYVGGHVDTANRRMISAIGCEEMCGYLWQWLDEIAPTGGSGWNSYGDGDNYGQSYGMPYVLLAGGAWINSSSCGSRSRNAVDVRSNVGARSGSRGSSRVCRWR